MRGLGSFVAEEVGASYDAASNSLRPPRKILGFSQTEEDGTILVHYISDKENISHKEAEDFIEKEVKEWVFSLKKDADITLGRIGKLVKNQNDTYTLQQYVAHNYDKNSFGLTSFVVTPVDKNYKPKVKYEQRPKVTKPSLPERKTAIDTDMKKNKDIPATPKLPPDQKAKGGDPKYNSFLDKNNPNLPNYILGFGIIIIVVIVIAGGYFFWSDLFPPTIPKSSQSQSEKVVKKQPAPKQEAPAGSEEAMTKAEPPAKVAQKPSKPPKKKTAPPAAAKPKKTKSVASPTTSFKYHVVYASHRSQSKAKRDVSRLKKEGYDAYMISANVKGVKYYRVSYAGFNSRREANNYLQDEILEVDDDSWVAGPSR